MNPHSGDAVDKSIIHSLESAVIEWSHQIHAVLKKDSSEPLLEGKNPTPLTELLFWRNRSANLLLHRWLLIPVVPCDCVEITRLHWISKFTSDKFLLVLLITVFEFQLCYQVRNAIWSRILYCCFLFHYLQLKTKNCNNFLSSQNLFLFPLCECIVTCFCKGDCPGRTWLL